MRKYVKLFESWMLSEAEETPTANVAGIKAIVDKYEKMTVADLMKDSAETMAYADAVNSILKFFRAGGKISYTSGTLPDKKKYKGATITEIGMYFQLGGSAKDCEIGILSNPEEILDKPEQKVIDALALDLSDGNSNNSKDISMKQLITMLYAGTMKRSNKASSVSSILGGSPSLKAYFDSKDHWEQFTKVLSGGGDTQKLANLLKSKVGSASPEAEA